MTDSTMLRLRLTHFCWLISLVLLGSLCLNQLGYLSGSSNHVSHLATVGLSRGLVQNSRVTTRPTDQTKGTVTESKAEEEHHRRSQHPLLTLQNTVQLIYKEFSASVLKFKSKKFFKKESPKRNVIKKHARPDCKEKPFLVIEVHSDPDSYVARQAIRLSWGRQSNDINKISSYGTDKRSWKTVFLVGKSTNERTNDLIQEEARTYRDVVIGDFLDTYRNLTLKTLLTLEWPAQHCSSAEYILKTDQDCYVNVFSVMKWLNRYVSKQPHRATPLYMGGVHWKNTPSRGNTSKYYVSTQEFSAKVYAPYAAGGGYVFTASLIPKLLEASKSTAVFPMEDAYFGSLMKRVGVKPTNQKRMLPYEFCQCSAWVNGKDYCETWYNDSVCNNAVAMVIHDVTPKEQISMHVNVLTIHHVPSICKHERIRESWNTNCKIV